MITEDDVRRIQASGEDFWPFLRDLAQRTGIPLPDLYKEYFRVYTRMWRRDQINGLRDQSAASPLVQEELNMQTARQSCFARMLDVRGFVVAARGATGRAEPGALMMMMAVFGFIALLLAPFWISFDLMSTWDFTTSIRDASAATIADMAYQLDSAMNMTLGAMIAGVMLTGYTLLPSLFELAFPTMQHPLLMILLVAAIVFDYVTDWPKSWATTATWGGAENGLVHILYSVFFCLFVSVGVQALLVICLIVVIFGALGLLRGGRSGGRVVLEG